MKKNYVEIKVCVESVGATNRGEAIEVGDLNNFSMPKTLGVKQKYKTFEEFEKDLSDPYKSKVYMSSQSFNYYAMGVGAHGMNLTYRNQNAYVASGLTQALSLRDILFGSMVTAEGMPSQKRPRAIYMTKFVQEGPGKLLCDFKANAISVREQSSTAISHSVNPESNSPFLMKSEGAVDLERAQMIELDGRNGNPMISLEAFLNSNAAKKSDALAAISSLKDMLKNILKGKKTNDNTPDGVSKQFEDTYVFLKNYANLSANSVVECVDKSLLEKDVDIEIGEFKKVGAPVGDRSVFGFKLNEHAVRVLLAYWIKRSMDAKQMSVHGFWKTAAFEVDGSAVRNDLKDIAEKVSKIEISDSFEKDSSSSDNVIEKMASVADENVKLYKEKKEKEEAEENSKTKPKEKKEKKSKGNKEN